MDGDNEQLLEKAENTKPSEAILYRNWMVVIAQNQQSFGDGRA